MMGTMFRKKAPAPQPVRPARTPEPSRAGAAWSDGFGLLAIRAVQIIAVVALVGGAIWGLQTLTVVVIPLLLAIVFAAAFEPLMHIMRRVMPPALATVIALLAVVVVIGGIVTLVVRSVISESPRLAASAQEGFDQIIAWVETLPFDIDTAQIQEWLATAQDFVFSSQFGSTIGTGALAGVSAVASFVTGFVLMVVILFFFLKDGPKIWEFVIRPFEGEWYDRMRRVGDKTVDTIGAYVRGTAAVAAVDAIGIGLGLWILQVPLWFPLMLVVFLLAFIPIVGATLAGVLGALVALVDGGIVKALIVVAIVVVVNQLEGNFLQPFLMGRALKLHALAILIALTIGTVLAGILGAVLAVPIAAVIWGVIQVWDGPQLPAKWARRKTRPVMA